MLRARRRAAEPSPEDHVMDNPWLKVPAADYEMHMEHDAVRQGEMIRAHLAACVERFGPKSLLYLEARCICMQRAMGAQGTQNGGIAGAPLAASIPGGVRELMAENIIAVWLDLECASGNDARSSESEIRIGASTVALDSMRASTPDGIVDLTERELMLIRFLAENDGRVVTRGELLERVWGYSFDTATRTLDTFIHRLRRYFEPDPQSPRHFHTVRGVGYRFTSESEE